MRTKEQIRQYNIMAQRARRASTPDGVCDCGQPAKYWTSDYQRECERCRRLETAQVKWSIVGAPQRVFLQESERNVAP
jgi:hypothetical protein